MKKIYITLCLLTIALFQASAASTYKETRTVVFTPAKGEVSYLLMPNKSITQTVKLGDATSPTRKFLRVIGGVKMPVPFQARGEEMFRRAEYFIDDNLDSVIVKKDRYSLYFKGEDNNFERHAYYRIAGNLLQSGELTVSLPIVKKNALSISDGGDFGVGIELFYKKPGRHADDIYDRPDSLLCMSIPSGSGKYLPVVKTFVLPDNVACALLRIGGTHFSGECWVEAPRLTQRGKAICTIPFCKFAQKENSQNYWIGCNLSTRSWPKWKLEYNGQTVFEGNMFDRSSNVADFYLPLPASLSGEGEMKLTLLKEDHRAAYPYELRGLEIIEETARDFEVISVPRYVTKGATFGLLIETNKPDVRLRINASAPLLPLTQEMIFTETGLHVVQLRAEANANAISIEVADENRTEQLQVEQIIDKEPEQIYVSSGDEIYIDKEYGPYDYFFKWYLSNRVGNWYQFRPSYQWSGFRVANTEVISHYAQLLDQLKVPYAWQVEGRTLAAKRINPDIATLSTPMFRGKQAHENDGGYYYWGHFKYQGVFSDMAARNRPYGGIFAKHRPIYTDHGTFIHYDPQGVKDMADGARTLTSNFRYSKGESTRHTGPSTLFRYLYQAGYDWLGAEQMYGPEETILSSLRGASRAYSKPLYGSLHAMQWGSGPFTDPKHSLRLYMSLAVAYMHGSSHINTEEALWTDEFMNDRYSPSGKEHLYAQHQVLDFVETHSRRGELTSNIAIIQGRNDGWKSFGRGSLWSQEGDKWKFNKACESFDLMRVFYPDNILDGCAPEGWFTSTPYGIVDLLPVEAPLDVMNRYKAMIFLGWNSYDEGDFIRIRDYVFNGGTLLLSAAHLNAGLQPDEPVAFPTNDALIREMLGDGYQKLTKETEIAFGSGRIVYFPQKAYPAEELLTIPYEAAMKQIATTSVAGESQRGWIKAAPSIGFAVWDSSDRRTIYLLNTDWMSEQEQQTTSLLYNGKKFPITVRRYHTETVHCAKELAVMPDSNTTDILNIKKTKKGWLVTVQNTVTETIRCMNASTGTSQTYRLDTPGIHHVSVE
ncbi:MAG: hypothetical protein RR249_04080 [Tannerellaceae bacterium]